MVSELHEKMASLDLQLKELLESITGERLSEKGIEDLMLSSRTYNCLKRAGVNTISDLTSMSRTKLMRLRNLGKSSLKEIEDSLHEVGLTLRKN